MNEAETILARFPHASESFKRKLLAGKPVGVARAQELRAVEIGNVGLPKSPASKVKKPDGIATFLAQMGLPKPMTELRFHATRKWRFDYAWPDHKIALEIEGGAWTNGRHTRGAGFIADMAKYNAAQEIGWRVFRVTPDQAITTETARMLRAVLS